MPTKKTAAPARRAPARRPAAAPPAQAADPRVQRGPRYSCWTCGAPVLSLRPWPKMVSQPLAIDEWADHIAYLELTCRCGQESPDASRVAVLFGHITPLYLPGINSSDETRNHVQLQQVQAVRTALAVIAQAIPEQDLRADPASFIVYSVLSGRWTPEHAIRQVKQLILPESMRGGK